MYLSKFKEIRLEKRKLLNKKFSVKIYHTRYKELLVEIENIKCLIKIYTKTDIATFEIKTEPLGLWDLWINLCPH